MQGLRRRWNCRLAGACGFQTATASFAAAAQTEAGWNAPSLSQVQWPNSHVMLDWSLGAVLVLLSLLVGVCLYLNRRLGKAVRARTTALTEYESRYREFAETAAHWLWEMDPELRFTWVSDSFKSATGLSPSDVIGHTRWDAAGVAEITGNWFEHREILSRRLAFEDFRYGYRDGLNSIRFVEISGKPIFDACNTFLGYRGTGRDVSERVRADASLTEREAELRGFYESAPLMMGVVEIHEDDLRHVSCNRSSATFLGATPEDLRGRPTAEVGLPRQVRKEWLRHTRQAERTEVPVSFEYDHPTNDGPRRVWGVMRRIDDGDRRLALYVLNDVTEQRRTEATLRRTAQILSEVSANMPGMVFQLRRDGNGHDRFEFVSQSAESLVGHSNERLLTDACLLRDSVLPDDLGHFLASLIHSAAWVVPWSCEFRILRRQDPRWIRVSATSARAEDGAIVWDGVMVDITELREREDRIRGIMEATIDAIVTIDEIGVIETVNRSTQTMFGYAAEQLLGRNINILMPPDYARQHGDYLQRYLKTGEARIIGFGREVEG